MDRAYSSNANPEHALIQATINDESSSRSVGKRNFSLFYEKDLREAAHAEVTQSGMEETGGKPSRKRKVLNADERAQQSRDRNREHAKNTRLRKKAYVYKLKELVDHMVHTKDLELDESKAIAVNLQTQQSLKRSAAVNFLNYRANNVRSKSKWAEVASEDITVLLPITPYRYFPKSEIFDGRRRLLGHESLVIDSASINLMMESIGQGTSQWMDWARRDCFPRLSYEMSTTDVVSAGDTVICRFMITVSHQQPTQNSSSISNNSLKSSLLAQPGMLYCKFDSHNRVATAEIVYDVMNFINQLQRFPGFSSTSTIVPNTIEMALTESSEARAILSSFPPYPILFVNNAWAAQTGYSQMDAEGKEFLKYFEPGSPELTQTLNLIRACGVSIPGRFVVHNSKSKLALRGRIESYYLKMLPLASEAGINSHILVVLQRLDVISQQH
jgi:PAS domain-containing protein